MGIYYVPNMLSSENLKNKTKPKPKLNVVAHGYNASTQRIEAGDLLGVGG